MSEGIRMCVDVLYPDVETQELDELGLHEQPKGGFTVYSCIGHLTGRVIHLTPWGVYADDCRDLDRHLVNDVLEEVAQELSHGDRAAALNFILGNH